MSKALDVTEPETAESPVRRGFWIGAAIGFVVGAIIGFCCEIGVMLWLLNAG